MGKCRAICLKAFLVIQVLSMKKLCNARIPISYMLFHTKLTGYLDPLDNIIYDEPKKQSCDLTNEYPVTINKTHYIYSRNGTLTPIYNLTNLPINLYDKFKPLILEPMPIFRHILLYNYGSLTTGIHNNQLVSNMSIESKI